MVEAGKAPAHGAAAMGGAALVSRGGPALALQQQQAAIRPWPTSAALPQH
jgi:hypothetical protein